MSESEFMDTDKRRRLKRYIAIFYGSFQSHITYGQQAPQELITIQKFSGAEKRK